MTRLSADQTLLAIERQLLWPTSGPVHSPRPMLVIASTHDAVRALVSHKVHPALAARLIALIEQSPATDPSETPDGMVECQQLISESYGPTQQGGGPSYLMAGTESVTPSPAMLVRFGDCGVEALRSANPGNWGEREWNDLIDGSLGPWAMAVHDGRIVSICHTPVSNNQAVEAGAWTHPDHRRRGYAAVTAAAWAELVAHSGRTVFYSTWASNTASQGLADKLGLYPIGWLRSVRLARDLASSRP